MTDKELLKKIKQCAKSGQLTPGTYDLTSYGKNRKFVYDDLVKACNALVEICNLIPDEPQDCPYCGKEGKVKSSGSISHVECCGCDLKAPSFCSEDEAISGWNKIKYD